MTKEIRLRPVAVQNLQDIWDYTAAKWSPDHAVRYLRGLEACFDTLAAYPRIGRMVAQIRPTVFVHRCQSHLIIYMPLDSVLDVIAVSHMRQHWQSLLDET